MYSDEKRIRKKKETRYYVLLICCLYNSRKESKPSKMNRRRKAQGKATIRYTNGGNHNIQEKNSEHLRPMSSPSLIRLEPTGDFHDPIDPTTTAETAVSSFRRCGRPLHETRPEFCDPSTAGWEHAVLEAVKDSTVDGRDEAAGDQAKDDARCEVVFSEAVA